MKEILSIIVSFLRALPLSIWIAGSVVIVVILMALTVIIRRASLMLTALKKMDIGESDEVFRAKLLSRPSLIEALIRRKGEGVISHFGVTEHLERRFANRKKPEDARRLLQLTSIEGAFPVFIAAMKNEAIAQVFRNWIKENTDIFVIRSMAMAARGRDFDGAKARRLLADVFEELRELSGDPEWPVRFFSLKILLADDDTKSMRMVKEAFSDPHPLLRRTVAIEAGGEDLDDLFKRLMTMVLDDPVPEVRVSARNRIESTFPHRWKLNPSGMDALQSVHVLELLKTGSKEDQNVAIAALGHEAAEARLAAARFLNKAGVLNRIFTEANRGDREDWERRNDLLSKAVSVGVTIFLSAIRSIDSVDVLLLGARLLRDGGDGTLIPVLAEKAFSPSDYGSGSDTRELYRQAASLACTKGGEKAQSLVRDELRKRRYDDDVLDFILPLLPPGEAPVFRDVLLEFLVDEEFTADEAYLEIMAQLPPPMFLGSVLDLLEADRSLHHHRVRLRALQVLGAWHLDYTLQVILENLPILPPEQFRHFAVHLAAMDREALEERVSFILSSPDAGIRAALISCLPSAGVSAFIKEIREGLGDADPDVRIACMRALFDTGELKASGAALALLRDPVERVRHAAAQIAGSKATERFLESLEELLNDKNESPLVRRAALEGLAASPAKESVNVLVHFLDTSDDLQEETIAAMTTRTDGKTLIALVEHFKDSEALLRDKISDVFAAMGEDGETALVAMLREDVASLKPFLADILTRTGFVEILIRKLGHRKPQIRRDAAELLAGIATKSAYRGIVLAARDPDIEVRIRVTRALESLATSEGEKILKSLETDPDRRVRRYTQWAMERLRAKKLP